MSLFKIFSIAGTGMAAQSQRLNTVASNIANADSAAGPDGKVYSARQVVFQSVPVDNSDTTAQGVRVASIMESGAPPRRLHDPKHPLADKDGFVTLANVSVVEEMVTMIAASRAYQNNVEVMNTAKNMLAKTLTLGS
ncbi:MAG: flagellar basal body rod protein FlgC [Betaproteobacteria bacterium]|nr:flagellar basal body rod protein FlgC [Betaproteobacteria bacterium]